jgi:hypothetical protein
LWFTRLTRFCSPKFVEMPLLQLWQHCPHYPCMFVAGNRMWVSSIRLSCCYPTSLSRTLIVWSALGRGIIRRMDKIRDRNQNTDHSLGTAMSVLAF